MLKTTVKKKKEEEEKEKGNQLLGACKRNLCVHVRVLHVPLYANICVRIFVCAKACIYVA